MWNWNSRLCPGLSAIGLLCGVLAARAGGATGVVYRSDFAALPGLWGEIVLARA